MVWQYQDVCHIVPFTGMASAALSHSPVLVLPLVPAGQVHSTTFMHPASSCCKKWQCTTEYPKNGPGWNRTAALEEEW